MKTFDARQARSAIGWARRVLNLADWEIGYCLDDEPPRGINKNICGQATVQSEKKAQIWVSPARCCKFHYSPLAVLFHEMLHLGLHQAGFHVTKQRKPCERLLGRRRTSRCRKVEGLEVIMERAYLHGK
jgi:hypothetical protein